MKIKTIGVEFVPANAFGRAIIEGVCAYAATRRDWKLLAIRQEDISKSTFRKCSGVILRVLDARTERLSRDADCPIVDLYCARDRPGIGQVSSDDRAAGRLAADFFLSRGFKRFAYCGINNLSYSDRAWLGFSENLRSAGFVVSCYKPPKALQGPTTFDDGSPDRIGDAPALREWLRTLAKPTALFCCNDYRAYQVVLVAIQSGLDIPHDLAVIGCDNDPTLCSFAPVPLSSVDSNAYGVGYAAAKMLHALMQDHSVLQTPRPLFIPPKELVERASTETVPIDPPWLSEAVLTIDRELASGISANRIFALSQHSPPHVEKVFRKVFGCSVQAYITDCRLKKAAELLSHTTQSVKAIALTCGYASSQYFCRLFKERFGRTPRAYAQELPS